MEDGHAKSRVSRSKEEARASYNRLSGIYDLLAGPSEQKLKDEGLELLAVAEGEKVLEIGFGTGQCLKALAASVGESGEVHGIDISEGMIEASALRLGKAGLAHRVSMIRGDAAALRFDAGSFDAVFSCFTLELFDAPEIPTVLSKCMRVLKPGGRACFVSMGISERASLMTKAYAWARTKFPTLIDCRPILVETELREAGFLIGSSERSSVWGLPVDIVLALK